MSDSNPSSKKDKKKSSSKHKKDKSDKHKSSSSSSGGGGGGSASARPNPNLGKKKDPNAPKRPRTAFLLFSVDKRAGVKREYPDLVFGDIAKQVSHLWANCPPEEKARYQSLAEEDKQRYNKEMQHYKEKQSRHKSEKKEEEKGEREKEKK